MMMHGKRLREAWGSTASVAARMGEASREGEVFISAPSRLEQEAEGEWDMEDREEREFTGSVCHVDDEAANCWGMEGVKLKLKALEYSCRFGWGESESAVME